jgi:hypothetical protein
MGVLKMGLLTLKQILRNGLLLGLPIPIRGEFVEKLSDLKAAGRKYEK